MSNKSRRDFLREAGLLAAALGIAVHKPLPRAQARASAGMPDSLWRPAPAPRVAPAGTSASAVTAYQLQTPRQAVIMDLINSDYVSRFDQLVSQGYRPIWLQGVGNGAIGATFSAIWVRDGVTDWYEWHNLTSAGYQERFDTYAGQGYLPISVTGYQIGSGETRFGAIWLRAPGVGYYGGHDLTGAGYQAFVNQMISLGMRPQAVDGFPSGAGTRYITIWGAPGSGAWEARHDLSASDYQSFFNQYTALGYRPISVSGYDVGSAPRFAAFMVKDGAVPGFEARHNNLPDAFYNTAAGQARGNGQPLVIDSYNNGAARNFAGVWIQKTRAWSVTGEEAPALAAFDTAMRDFMQARNIPAGALAVTRNSRLALARGYRWQSDTIDPVQPTSLFRIASLSKQITSMAVMRLVEDGLLSLSSKLTALLALTPAAGFTMDARMNDITVRMLLEHSGGWDRDGTGFDPMFQDQYIHSFLGVPLPVSQQNIITVITGRALDFAPGTQYAYSNYGYLLLGRIIEAVSGLPYAAYVQQHVFDPLFIKRMRMGYTEFEQRQPGEVPYYCWDVGLHFNVRRAGAPLNAPAPYGAWNLENMDSHGGWLASAVDLARFTTALDASGRNPVLNAESIAQTFAVPLTGAFPDGAWYARGWMVRPVGGGLNTWHNGSLDGTFTFMVRRYDGVNYVALFDQRDDPSGLSYDDIDGLLYDVADSITAWPGNDLFPSYGLPSPGRYYTHLPAIKR